MKIKNKSAWFPGVPENPGIYWFNAGFRDTAVVVLKISDKNDDKTIFGNQGCMPLSMVYVPSISTKAKYAEISKPNRWTEELKFSKKDHYIKTWVKRNGWTGLGILQKDNVGYTGTIIWLDHPDCDSICGEWLRSTDGYLYSQVKIPK